MDADKNMVVSVEQVEKLEKIADEMLKDAEASYKRAMETLDQKLQKVQKVRAEDDDAKDKLDTYLTFIQETVRDAEREDDQTFRDHLDTHDYIMLECGGDATLNETLDLRNNNAFDHWEFDMGGEICADFVTRAWSRDPMLSCIFFLYARVCLKSVFFFILSMLYTEKELLKVHQF